MRIQLALNVKNINDAIEYYSKMFGVEPHKTRAGYANYSIDDPSLKLVLFENPNANENLNHLGVEVFTSDDIDDSSKRFDDAGILQSIQTDSTCCHAEQDKVWTKDKQNLSWEWYLIKDDNPSDSKRDESECCSDTSEPSKACC